MGKYHVIRPAKIGGAVHKPGMEPVEFDDKLVKPLVKSGALKLHVEKASAAPDEDVVALLKVEVIEDLAKTAANLDTKLLWKAYAQAKKAGKAKEWLAVIDAELEKRKDKK